MLNIEEQNKLKKKIELKIRLLKLDIDTLVEETKPIAPENSLGRITRMDAINKKGVNEAALRQARKTLNKLELALNKIENNDVTYGKCHKCEASIPFQRLILMPESTHCVKCAN